MLCQTYTCCFCRIWGYFAKLMDNRRRKGYIESMINLFEKEFEVGNHMVDKNNNIKLSELERVLVDTASEHVKTLGFGTDILNKKGYTWVISKMAMHIKTLPKLERKIIVKTWPLVGGKLAFDRDFSVQDESGNTLVLASSRWCVINVESRRPVFKQTLAWNVQENEAGSVVDVMPGSTVLQTSQDYVVNKSDLDFNNHMTNTRYFDLAIDTINSNNQIKLQNSTVQLHFINEATLGEHLRLNYGNSGNKYFVTGVSTLYNHDVFRFELETRD